MLHSAYRENLTKSLTAYAEDKTFADFWQDHKKEFLIILFLILLSAKIKRINILSESMTNVK